MVHEQEYIVKVKVTGRSTMWLENFENMLASICEINRKNNVHIKATSKDGMNIIPFNKDFSFDKYINGECVGRQRR